MSDIDALIANIDRAFDRGYITDRERDEEIDALINDHNDSVRRSTPSEPHQEHRKANDA